MPYITKADRERYREPLLHLRDVIQAGGITNGDLNFLMTFLALLYVEKHGESYNTLSDVVKAFECAKLEFYRRKVSPYEDRKIMQNGDIYA